MCRMCNYTVFEKPTDYPNHFVCRVFHAVDGKPVPEAEPYMVTANIEPIRERMQEMGLVVMGRFAADLPQIVEVWMSPEAKDLTELGVMLGL